MPSARMLHSVMAGKRPADEEEHDDPEPAAAARAALRAPIGDEE